MEEYSPWPDSSRAPETIQPLPNRIDLKAKIFTEFDVRNPLRSTSPCTFVDPRNRNVQGARNLRNRHQLAIPFIRRHASPHVVLKPRACVHSLFSGTARTRISPLLPVTKNIRAKHSPLLTALHPASLRNVHVPARHLSRFVSSLCAPPSSAHLQRAEQISLGTPKELLN